MKLYGEKMLQLGIILIIIILIAAAVFLIIHRITSNKLKKQLEQEYGKNK